MNNIKWEVFTKEEQDIIKSLVSSGSFDAITRAVMMDSPEKEFWIHQLLEQVKPLPEVIDSKVKQEMLDAKLKGEEITSPEKEAEWQKKLEEEKELAASKKKAKKSADKK